MALFSPKSKDWLYTLETVNRLLKEDPNRTGVSLADELGISSAQASNFTTLNGCLDQAAIDKIRSAASQQMPYSTFPPPAYPADQGPGGVDGQR